MSKEALKLALEAGPLISTPFDVWCERFAALVAAAEREKVAAWMMQQGYATGHGDIVEDLLKELEWQVRESEREACAKVCDELFADVPPYSAPDCADAIRARGQA